MLFERVGLYTRSHNVPRRSLPGYQDRAPVGEALREWMLAHPRPFAEPLESAAKEGGVPVDLLTGLVREESGFNPEIESWANAIGLGQQNLSLVEALGGHHDHHAVRCPHGSGHTVGHHRPAPQVRGLLVAAEPLAPTGGYHDRPDGHVASVGPTEPP